MKTLSVCFILLLAAVLRVYCLPVDPKLKENAARLGRAGAAGGLGRNVPGLDKNEYKRYWEEAVKNNPELAARVTELQSKQNLNLEQVAELYPQLGDRLARDSKNVRSQMEEARRMGIEEVRQLQRLQMMRDNNLMPDGDWMTKREAVREHLPPRFTNDDIQNRLQEQRHVLNELDQKRAEEFKRYEMKMEHQRREKLKEMDEKKRLEAEEQFRQLQATQRQHEKVRHPASKDQLEEVWEKDDGLKREEFDAKTFFFLHDTNGDKHLDPMEIEALFRNELKKVYGNDLNGMEAHEDLARMREHVVKEIDVDSDGFVSMKEFISYTTNKGFSNEEEWEAVVDETPFSEDELEHYEEDYYEYYDYEYDSKGRVVGLKPLPKKDPAGGNPDEKNGDLNRNPNRPPPPPQGRVEEAAGMVDHGLVHRGKIEENIPAENPDGGQVDHNRPVDGGVAGERGDQEAEPVVAQQQNTAEGAPVKMDDNQLNINAAPVDGRAQQFEKNPPPPGN